MNTQAIAKRSLEVLGLLMIGEGVVGLLFPVSYPRFWNFGPDWMRKTATAFAERPEMTRLICAAEIAAGLALAAHELDA